MLIYVWWELDAKVGLVTIHHYLEDKLKAEYWRDQDLWETGNKDMLELLNNKVWNLSIAQPKVILCI